MSKETSPEPQADTRSVIVTNAVRASAAFVESRSVTTATISERRTVVSRKTAGTTKLRYSPQEVPCEETSTAA